MLKIKKGVKMKFRNLVAEMVKNGITKSDIATLIDKKQSTVTKKINGKISFYMSEVLKIRDMINPRLSIEYLFAE